MFLMGKHLNGKTVMLDCHKAQFLDCCFSNLHTWFVRWNIILGEALCFSKKVIEQILLASIDYIIESNRFTSSLF